MYNIYRGYIEYQYRGDRFGKKRILNLDTSNVLYQQMHGYEIINETTMITNDVIKVGAGTLYTLLLRFLSDGYIELVDEID